MKLLIALSFLLAFPCFGDETVRGALAPLGHVIEVEGEIVDGSTLRKKEWEGVSLLRVEQVDGKPLGKPVVMRFAWHALASDSSLSGKVRLIGYETGEFTGIPEEAFKHIPRAATSGFHFQRSFMVLKSQPDKR